MSDHLERYRDLRAGPGPDHFVIEGVLALERLLASELAPALESVVCTPAARARLELPADLPVTVLDKRELAELAGFEFHRGVLACARRPDVRRTLDDATLEQLRARPRVTVVVAEGLADPRNLGALARNLAAFAGDLLIADARGADPFSRLAIRASVGNVFRIPTLVGEALPELVTGIARSLDAEILAATPSPALDVRPLPELEPKPRRILLVGNEGDGLSPALLARADTRVRVPIAASADSLNVAAATAILLYALSRD